MRLIIAAIIVTIALNAVILITATQQTDMAYLPSPLPLEESPPPTDAVSVTNFRSFPSGDSSLYVVGEVTNNTDSMAYAVEVEIRLYDAADTLLLNETVFAQVSQIAPNGRAGFIWITAFLPNNFARAEASVISQSVDPWPGYTLATVVSATSEITSSGVRAVGQVRNDHAAALNSVKIAAIFYDAEGNVLDVSNVYLDTPLQSGATANFTINDYLLSSCEHIAVTAEGFVPSQ